MGDVGDDYRALKEKGQRRRASNRETSPEVLKENGVKFESKNLGAHLIVEAKTGKIDFWPGTGKWIARNGRRGAGVFPLIKYIKEQE